MSGEWELYVYTSLMEGYSQFDEHFKLLPNMQHWAVVAHNNDYGWYSIELDFKEKDDGNYITHSFQQLDLTRKWTNRILCGIATIGPDKKLATLDDLKDFARSHPMNLEKYAAIGNSCQEWVVDYLKHFNLETPLWTNFEIIKTVSSHVTIKKNKSSK